MLDFLKNIFKPEITPLNYIKIYKDNILYNYKLLQTLQPGGEMFPVLKSNAYGHGLKEVSQVMKESDAKLLCVDSFPEYQIVKKYSGKNVLVLGENRIENYKNYNLTQDSFCVYTLEVLEYFVSLNKGIKIHLFINTGMNREGFQEDELKNALALLKNSQLILEGVCSHFAGADEVKLESYQSQIDNYKAKYNLIEQQGFTPQYKHIGASAGTIKSEDSFFNAFRPGVALYGVNPLEARDPYYMKYADAKLAMEVYSTVIKIQNIKKGEKVSYNGTFTAQKDTCIAVIPFGYFEGLSRKLSNNYHVEIDGKQYPLVGNVCMNISMIDIGNDDIKLGDEVKVLGSESQNDLYFIAEKQETIPYESMVKFHPSIRREIV